MCSISTARIGQVVGLGFALILCLALLIGLMGRIAYEISKRQNNIIQTRGDVGNLSLQLEMLAIQRTEALRRYLESEDEGSVEAYQAYQDRYAATYEELAMLLHTPAELQALQTVKAAEANFEAKAQEMLRLYEDFPSSAYFLWTNEGRLTRDNLLESIRVLRQIQNDASTAITEQAHSVERLAITIISIFIFLVFGGGMVASLLITRSITRPISALVKTISTLKTDLTARVAPSGPREIAFLGETVNDMAANLFSSRQSLQAYKDRLEKELALASQIQASFLPTTLPQAPGLELAVFWRAAREVGGDFYTFVELGDGQRGIALGDVSGKGTPAAMAGALSVGLLGAYAAPELSPALVLSELNKDLCVRLAANPVNVACCYAVINMSTACLTVANAGAMYPYLRRDSELYEIDVRGLPLGAWIEADYAAQSLNLQPGDLLIFSSDGLIEAKNERGQMFGFERLQTELLKLPAGLDAQGVVDRLTQLVLNFTGQHDLHDDITILATRIVDLSYGQRG